MKVVILDAAVYDRLMTGEWTHRDKTMEEWDRWALLGADVVRDHPDFPDPLTVELDTSKGCVRYINKGCSFCIEPMYGKPKFRDVRGPRGGPSARGTRGRELPPRRPGGLLQLPGDRTRLLADPPDQRACDPRASRRDPGRRTGPEGLAYRQRRSRDDDRASGGCDCGDERPGPACVSRQLPVVRTRVRGSARHGGEQPQHRRGRLPRGDPHGERGRARAGRERHADPPAGAEFRRGPGGRVEEDVRLEPDILEAASRGGPLGPPH